MSNDTTKDWLSILAHYKKNTEVEGIITDVVRGGFNVMVSNCECFLPNKACPHLNDKDKSIYLNTSIKVFIHKINALTDNIVVTTIKDDEKALTINDLTVGDILDGIVKRVESYGIFVTVNGLDGLVYINEISWQRVDDIHSLYSVNDPVRVKIIAIDSDNNRIYFSIKQLDNGIQKDFYEDHQEGNVLVGYIKNIIEHGIVVGFEGYTTTGLIYKKLVPNFYNAHSHYNIDDNIQVMITMMDRVTSKLQLRLVKYPVV